MSNKKENDMIENLEDKTTPDIVESAAPEIGTPSGGILENAEVSVSEQAPTESLADKVRVVSPFKLVLKRFFRSKLSVIGLTMFIAVLLFSFLGPVFVPWGEKETDMSPSYKVFYNNEQRWDENEDGNTYDYYVISSTRNPSCNEHAPAFTYGYKLDGTKAIHVLGTDKDGYDIFVRIMYGGRMSILLAFMVVLVYSLIGIVLGGLAGYFGGWVDMVIMRIVDILNCIPSLPILLIVGAIYNGLNGPPDLRVYVMMGVLTMLSWPGTCRLVRGQILFLREQEYIIAADALGFGIGRKIFKHLIPNVLPQLIVSMTLGLGGTILSETTLSYLSLGAPKETASLGQMVNLSTNPINMEFYVLDWLPAGIMIILAVVAFNFIGDGLRDALDPKMKR